MVAKRKNQLQLHKDQECACFDNNIALIDNKCVYQTFPDGWDFTPDVGNGQKRGEVFTPLWVVNKMITDVGLIPKEAVYKNDYSSSTPEKIVLATVVEPAVGTGNYSSTVLYHKLNYVKQIATINNKLDLSIYNEMFLNALSSIFVFDIDAGNLETTKQRFLKTTNLINSEEKIVEWTNTTFNSLEKENQTGANKEIIKSNVVDSLDSAQNNWNNYLVNDGVCNKFYFQHTGLTIPEWLVRLCVEIMNDNFKLFNGIVEQDTIGKDFIVAGFKNVVWDFKIFNLTNNNLSVDSETIPLLGQIRSGELEELSCKMESFKKDHFVEGESFDLFSSTDPVWDTIQNQKLYLKMVKEFDKLKIVVDDLEKSVVESTKIISVSNM